MGGGHSGGFRTGLLELDDAQRHPVHVQNDVESSMQLTRAIGDLVHRQPIILLGDMTEQTNARILLDPVGVDVADRIAAGQVIVDAVILADRIQRPRRWPAADSSPVHRGSADVPRREAEDG